MMAKKKPIRRQHRATTAFLKLETPPKWVIDMHDYFRTNGHYRVEDIHRVLGDQHDRVEVQASTDIVRLSNIIQNRT